MVAKGMQGMAEYAPVGNLNVYKALDRLGVLGHYHLLLAHQVVEQWEAYQDFYIDRKNRGHNDSVILDNSLIELGHPLNLEQMTVAISVLNSIGVLEALVLPDVQRDVKRTKEASQTAFRALSESGLAGTPVLGVVQGLTEDECYECAIYYMAMCNESLKLLSVPRWMTEYFGTREFILEEVLNFRVPVHLLGFSDNLYDDFKCASKKGVRGIDSAVPIWLGMKGQLIGARPRLKNLGSRPPWYNNWYEPLEWADPSITAEVLTNLMCVNAWLDPIRSILARPNVISAG